MDYFRARGCFSEQASGVAVCAHVLVLANLGAPVVRAYTPICAPGTRGRFTLAVKVYRAHVHPDFPQGGAMSQHLDSLQVGLCLIRMDVIEMLCRPI